MLYQVKYILSVVVEAKDENEAGGKGRKNIAVYTDNKWWNEHLLNIEVEKLGKLEMD